MVRIYHAGRAAAHRARDRALVEAGVDLTLVVPSSWSERDTQGDLANEPFPVIELPVVRSGDVNRHRYASASDLGAAITSARPDLIDIHEEALSSAAHQVLSVASSDLPVVMYAAQNLDKRYPPPFTWWERAAYRRVHAIYACSRQAASVVRGRGYHGHIRVIPLGFDETVFCPGEQSHAASPFVVSLVGRLVPEKGLRDAIHAFAAVAAQRTSRFIIGGSGPESSLITAYCDEGGVDRNLVEVRPWLSIDEVADVYRQSHVILTPSLPTTRIAEQFGRMVPEAQASGAVVAGYATGALPEVAAGAAWLCETGDLFGLRRAAASLATDMSIWEALRAAGLGACRDKTWRCVATAQVAVYEEAIAATAPGAVAKSRSNARTEFGAPARTSTGVARPFALPCLRTLPAPLLPERPSIPRVTETSAALTARSTGSE